MAFLVKLSVLARTMPGIPPGATASGEVITITIINILSFLIHLYFSVQLLGKQLDFSTPNAE